MKVTVTGGRGFIGSHFVESVLEKGWRVYDIDKMGYASHRSLPWDKDKNYTLTHGNIANIRHLPTCDIVVNFAAESHVDNSITNCAPFIESNVIGVHNLLELIRTKPKYKRPLFFHISTDEVYGDITTGEHIETDILKPSNPYSASKAAADMLIFAWARTYNINYLILRPTNNYGIGQYPEKLIPVAVKLLMREKKLKLHDRGEPIRNWLHSDDTASAVAAIIEAGVVNEIFNVAGGFEQRNIDTVCKVCECFFGEKRDWTPYLELSFVREGQDVRYALNDNKLHSLGWRPKRVFDREIKKIVEHYKNTFKW